MALAVDHGLEFGHIRTNTRGFKPARRGICHRSSGKRAVSATNPRSNG